MKNLGLFLICICSFGFQKSNQIQLKQQTSYKFEPAISTLAGNVKQHIFSGPPGYGENPKYNKKETVYILHLVKLINVVAEDPNDDFNKTTYNVKKLQLNPMGNFNLKKFKNKLVKISGLLFGAQTGHHYTEVLISVKTIEVLK